MSSNTYTHEAQFDTVRSLAFGSISGTYANVGTAFSDRQRILIIYNGLDVLATVSLSGGNDHFVLPAGSTLTIDLNASGLHIGSSHRVQVKATSATSGSIYVSAVK